MNKKTASIFYFSIILGCFALCNGMNTKHVDFSYKGHNFKFFDSVATSFAINVIHGEILDGDYTFDDFVCKEGDIMIDIGGHVGMISILYAKLYPQLKIYTFEPVPANYRTLLYNIRLNNVSNIKPYNLALTKDGRDIVIQISPLNTGGATALLSDINPTVFSAYRVKSISLDELFKRENIKACKMLKIDCEGSEHEVLLNTQCLNKVEYMVGEFHMNDVLAKQGHSLEKLRKHCLSYGIKMKVKDCKFFDGVECK